MQIPKLTNAGLVAIVAIVVIIAILWIQPFSKKQASPEPSSTVPDEQLAQLREIYKGVTTKKIDSCEYVLVPFVGQTRGFTITHKGDCSNKDHYR